MTGILIAVMVVVMIIDTLFLAYLYSEAQTTRMRLDGLQDLMQRLVRAQSEGPTE